MTQEFTNKTAQYEKRVDAGVRYLNKYRGIEWIYDIDIDLLKLKDTSVCILGQLYEGFWKKVLKTGEEMIKENHIRTMTFEESIKLGFAEKSEDSNSNYDLLTGIWVEKINDLKRD